ncbi:MAG: pteridine-dependent deoxygenase [Gammaproteobacteria bacterium]
MSSTPFPRSFLATPKVAETLASEPGTLALIGFDGARDAGDGHSAWIGTGLKTLAEPFVQVWQVATPVQYDHLGRFTTRTAPGIVMLAATLPDAEDPGPGAEELYRELFAAIEGLGCPHLLRVWQYLPRITEARGEEDRYRVYCAGRRRAFMAAGRSDATLPAACLLGDAADRILLYALAADTPGRQIENPRQQSAFRYPERYGRLPPSFSRALAVHRPGGEEQLYISGTASITGHASRHQTTLAQLEETLANLEALVGNWRGAGGDALAAIAPMKVYLRHADDIAAVRSTLEARLPEGHPVAYLRADVCRPELRIEIEGMVQATARSKA